MSLFCEHPMRVRTFAVGEWVGGRFVDGTAAVWSLTVDTAADAEVYGVDLAAPVSVSVSVSASVGSTPEEIAEDLTVAWNLSGAGAYATAEAVGGAIMFTAVAPGVNVDLALDENAVKMTLAQPVVEVAPSVEGAFMGTWRPMPAREIQLLESGDRERDPRVLYTETRLTLGSQYTHRKSAWVSPDSGTTWYELLDEYDGWSPMVAPGIQHYRYKALRVQEADA